MPRRPEPPSPLPLPADWRPRVGAALRAQRKALGLSRDALAERVGYSRNHVLKAERGVEVSLEALVLTCSALGLQPSVIFAQAGL